ncbi:MAG: hypothetical protein IJ743_01095 [Bacilli bacterium]|nr:hypothetical protein [Bacilli bacterium]
MENKKKLTIGLIVALITLVTGISYAYFTATFQNLGERETSITAAEMGSLKLTATETTYTSGNQYPGDMAIQKFTVEPVSKGKGVYELDLTGVIDETIFGSDVEIQLYKSMDNTEVTITEGNLSQEGENYSRVDTLVTNGLTPIYNKALKNGLNILYQEDFEVIEESGSLKVRENSTSTSYPKYTFYLVYNYKNNGNQNNQMGKSFTGTISGKLIKEKRRKTAIETILDLAVSANPNSTSIIDNGTDASGCTNTLAYDDFENLRYVGANPCNYVTFNNETAGWRIIGIVDGKIKMIHNNYIMGLSWDSSASDVNSGYGINQWGESGDYTGADLMKLLNPGYEENLAEDENGNPIEGMYANNSLYWNRESGNCYNYLNNSLNTCEFTENGLLPETRTMISKTTWHTGSQGDNDVETSGNKLGLASKFYEYERSNNTGKMCTSSEICNDTVERTTTWEGYVGLMSPSDYGYAVGGEGRDNCLSNINLRDYHNNNCNDNDWIYDSEYESITIMPVASLSNGVYDIFTWDDSFGDKSAGAPSNIKPTLFLDPSLYISGDGTSTNPYVLSFE